MKVKVHSGRVKVAVTRTVVSEEPATGAKSWRSVPNGVKSATVELWIDLDSLLESLGEKAVRSRGGRSRLASGDIEARVTGTVHHEREATP